MNTAALENRLALSPSSKTALTAAARLWFFIMVIGEIIFTSATVSFYGSAALHSDEKALTKFMSHGYIAGDTFGNFIVAVHIVSAVIINLGGVLQLVPQIRQRLPIWHRWIGRVYLTTAAFLSLAGLYITWIRAGAEPASQHLGISLDALLILACALLSLRHALARRFDAHRRWALRLFVVANGSFFFRTGVFFWMFVNHGPVGFDPDTFQGPFLTFLSFAESLVPLVILELYLLTKDRAGSTGRWVMATGLSLASVALGIGISVLTMAIWMPLILHKPLSF